MFFPDSRFILLFRLKDPATILTFPIIFKAVTCDKPILELIPPPIIANDNILFFFFVFDCIYLYLGPRTVSQGSTLIKFIVKSRYLL